MVTLNQGLPCVYVCDKCGQPLEQGELCNSSIHVGPGEQPNGKAIPSTELAEELREWRAYVSECSKLIPGRGLLCVKIDGLLQELKSLKEAAHVGSR